MSRDRRRLTVSPSVLTCANVVIEYLLQCLRSRMALHVTSWVARSDRTPWKAICWQFGIACATANRRYQYRLSVIAWRLNGRRVPRKRSRQFMISMMGGALLGCGNDRSIRSN